MAMSKGLATAIGVTAIAVAVIVVLVNRDRQGDVAGPPPPKCNLHGNNNRCVNELPATWASSTPQQKLDFLGSVPFESASFPFVARAKDDANCTKANPEQRVSAVAQNLDMPPPQSWPKGARVVLARIDPKDNANECADAFYHVGGIADAQYFVLVEVIREPGPPPGPGDFIFGDWTVVALSPSLDTVVRRGKFKKCGHADVPRPKSDARFATCASAPPPVPPETAEASGNRVDATLASLSPQPQTLALQGDPVWVSCALGCCTAGDPEALTEAQGMMRPKRTPVPLLVAAVQSHRRRASLRRH